MSRVKFDMKISPEGLIDEYDKNIKYISENRTTRLEYHRACDKIGRYVVPVIRYKIFDKYSNVNAGFSTRLGGVSREHLESLNLSFSRGDENENVLINHERFAKAVGYDMKRLVFSDQIHKTGVYKVTSADCGKGITIESDIKGIDALITNEKNIPLITFYADCVPLYIYDTKNAAIGLAHSGWRGTVSNIAAETIAAMSREYNTKPKELVCAIGPSICQTCYEVSQDVYEEFAAAYSEEEIKAIFHRVSDEKLMLDLHEACRINFIKAGVPSSSISKPDICTCCNPHFLYSHRASKGQRGNLAAVMLLQ